MLVDSVQGVYGYPVKDGAEVLAAISEIFYKFNYISRRCCLGSAFFICSKTPFVGADACIGPRGVGDAAPLQRKQKITV